MHMFTSLLLKASSGGGDYSSLIFLVLIMVVFYFFFIRPQAKKAKDLKKYREALKKGDRIVTIGGIHGKIVEVQDTTFTVEVEDGSRLRIEKSAVAGDATDQLVK
ncbi:preprotein translocase subunit YajC [Lentimicrobium sp.]